MKAELSTVKTIAIVALVVGALSLVANVAVFVWIFSKRQSAVEADDEE
jgi:flagellar basal body-associated protein FliL